jgi:hypothetical protein
MSLIQVATPIAYSNNTQLQIDIPNSLVYDIGGNLVIDWTNGLYKYQGTTVLDLNISELTDQDTENSVMNWHYCSLNDNTGNNTSVDWNNRKLQDSSGNNSVDWTNRKLYYSGGGLTVDWGNSKLYDGGGNVSFDWVNTQIFWGGDLVADFFACQLTDQSGNDNMTLDWHNCILYDNSASNNTSVDWNNRTLNNTSGTAVMGFASGIGFFGTTPVGQQTGPNVSASGTYGTNEMNMLNAVYSALKMYGLLAV